MDSVCWRGKITEIANKENRVTSFVFSSTGLAKNPFSVFHEVKDTFFIFPNNFIDLDFEYDSCLPCVIMLIVLNVLI